MTHPDYTYLLMGYGGMALLGLLRSAVDDETNPSVARRWDTILFTSLTGYSIYFCGLRAFDVGADTKSYLHYYSLIAQETDFGSTGQLRVEWFFYLLVKIVSSTVDSEWVYLLILHLLFLLPFRYFLTQTMGTYRGLLFFVYVSCFFYYSLNLNVVRNAVAIGLALMAVWQYHQRHFTKALLLMLVALQFHFTAVVVGLPLLLIRYFSGIHTKILSVFSGAALLAIAGFSLTRLVPYIGFLSLLQAKLSGYGSSLVDYNTGFRFDFSLFNLVFLLIGLQARKRVATDSFYYFVVTLYGLISGLFVLSFQVPYSDRVGLWSWVFIPFIVGYPAVQRQPRSASWVVIGSIIAGIVSLYMTRIQYQF